MVLTDLALLPAFLAPLLQCCWFKYRGRACSPALVVASGLGAVTICAAAAWGQGVLSPGWLHLRGVLALPAAAGLCILIGWLHKREVRLADVMSQNRWLLNIIHAQERRLSILEPQTEELRRARHDIRHCLRMLERTAGREEGEADDLAHCAQMRTRLADTEPQAAGEPSVLGALVHDYEVLARARGISTDIRVNLENLGGVALSDLGIVTSNLLENAVEAVSKETGGKFIRVRTDNRPGWIFIVVGNTFSGHFSPHNKRYLSSKQAGRYGVGLESVIRVAERYGGNAEFLADDGMFLASVFLAKPEVSSENRKR